MEGVNLWSLTSVARKKIIHRMKLENIVELSFKSNHFHEFLKHHKLPQVELEWKFNRNNWGISLKCLAQKNEEVTIAFPIRLDDSDLSDDSDEGDSVDADSMKPVKRRLDNKNSILPADKDVEFTVEGYRNNFYIENYHGRKAKMNALAAISKHVGEICHLTYKLYRSGRPTFDIFESFVFQTTKSFSRVDMGGGQHLSWYERFTEQQLRFLVEHLDIEDLRLKCSLETGGKLKNVQFNQKRLTLTECGSLFEPNELFNNTRLEYIVADFEKSDLLHFVRIADNWQKGTGFHNLKKVDIKAHEWSAKRQLRLQKDGTLGLVRSDDKNFQDFSETIKRFSDGKEAEVKAYPRNQRYMGGHRVYFGFFKLTVKESDQSSS